LPRAANYYGSELSLGIISDARPIPIYLNGVDVGTRYADSFLRGPIGSRPRPGRNVIAFEAAPGAVSIAMTLRARVS